MSVQLNRVARLTVYRRDTAPGRDAGARVFATPLRIQFSIKKTVKSAPNKAEITLTNLAPESREFLAQPGLVAQLEVGHEDALRLIFFGDVRYADSTPDGTEWQTQILASDGGHAYVTSRVSKSYRAGTSTRTVLRDCAASLGLTLPTDLAADPALDAALPSGLVLEGYTRDRLTEILRTYGYRWSIQGGKLQVLRDDQVRRDLAYVIDQDNGMIRSPEIGAPKEGAKARTLSVGVLLYPEIAAGALVQIRSRVWSGNARAETVTHEGDTHGEPWTTTVEATLR